MAMPMKLKRLIAVGIALPGLVLAGGWASWGLLTYEPQFYRAAAAVPRAQRQEQAKRFMAQSLQLRNDICNEPHWEAVFSDQEVNAWLAEDLVTHFADQIPPEVHEPRVVFEADRVVLAFQMDQGPLRSIITVVARVRVPEQNVIELTLEKIRAGAVPVPADSIIEKITHKAQTHGFDITWTHVDNVPVAVIRYTTDLSRTDVVLEHVHVRNGEIRLAGRSNRVKGAVVQPVLPRGPVLQSALRRRTSQNSAAPSATVPTALRSSSTPTS